MMGGFGWLHMFYTYFIWLVMLGSSVAVTLVLVASAVMNPDGYPDPFAAYDALTPHQPVAVLKTFDCQSLHMPDVQPGKVCQILPKDDVFERVVVTARDDRLQYIVYYAETLQVVDLVRRWGKPDVITQSSFRFILRWQDEIMAFAPITAPRFNHQLPVKLVIVSPPD
jgi:hypothetical protein